MSVSISSCGDFFSSGSRTGKLLVICLFIVKAAYPQSSVKLRANLYQLQTGMAIKAILEIGVTSSHPNPQFRISADFGVASLFLNSWLYPSINQEFELYNGGLGSRNRGSIFSDLSFDAITALTVTGGLQNALTGKYQGDHVNRNIPLYYFASFVEPALQNPFHHSLSLGTNLIFSPDKGKLSQRVGFLNVHVGRFQLSYFNDGGALMHETFLGDRLDRYYTGGGGFYYNLDRNAAITSLQMSYLKYTGYTRNAFELSNRLYLSYMNYHEEDQKYFNKSLWTFKVANEQKGIGFSVKSYNSVKLDLQHVIHFAIFNAYHMVTYPSYLAFSLEYNYSHLNQGLQ